MRVLVFGLAVLVAGSCAAQSWSEPERGTETRSALMDALRPHAEWMLGAPIQFVVRDLRVAGDVGFGSVTAQRPGGARIDLGETPGAARGSLDAEFMDGATLQALFQKSGSTWVAVHWALGATDVWYSYRAYCDQYRAVIPEVC